MASKGFRNFSIGTLAYTVGVIVWGAYVRATGSGAGCGSHWPDCNGEVIPRAPSVQTLIEYTHRLTSGLSLLLIAGMAVWAYRAHVQGHPVRRWALASLVFVLLEAALGAGLVLLELVALDASVRRALAMSLHLVNTFLLLYALAACVFHAAVSADRRPRFMGTPGGAWVVGAHVLLLWVGSSGAIAALGDSLSQHGVSTPLVALLIRLRIAHPLLAIVGVLVCGIVASHAFRRRPELLNALRLFAGLLAAQVLAGVLNVVLLAPVAMQLIHLVLADCLWISLVLVTRAAWSYQSAPLPVAAARRLAPNI
jgi:cytochrome c oxidase assembly protein subunit 15